MQIPEKEIKKPGEKKPQNKGFYVAIGLSVAMIGAACFFAVNSDNKVDRLNSPTPGTSIVADVDTPQTNIPKPSTAVKQTTKTTPKTTAKTTVKTTKATEAQKANTPVANVPKTAYAMPVEGEVLNAFSNGELVKSNTTGAWQTHNGADFAGTPGDPVYSITDGTITEITDDALWGVTVVIDHGEGVIAKYCGLAGDLESEVGSVVKGGSQIGTVGEVSDIESSDPAHVHVEITKNGRYVDPVAFIG